MLLDDLLEHRWIALTVPGTLGIDDGNRSAFANAQAVGFRAQNPALLRQPQLLEPVLEEIPRRLPTLLVTALRFRLIAAEKDMPSRHGDADMCRDGALRLTVTHRRIYAVGVRAPNSRSRSSSDPGSFPTNWNRATQVRAVCSSSTCSVTNHWSSAISAKAFDEKASS